MKFRDFFRPLPPLTQRAVGLRQDAAFNQPEPGILETLFAWGSNGRLYELPPEDRERLRPVYLKSERTIRNERIASRRAAARGVPAGPRVHSLPDGGPAREPYSWRPGEGGDGGEPGDGGGVDAEARKMAHPNSFVRSAGAADARKSNELENWAAPESRAPEIVDATAAMLTGGKRWSVRRPRK